MKKLLAAVLLIATVFTCLGALSSCGQDTKAFVIPEGGYDGSEVTITFYHTMGENLRTVLDDYIVEFNKLYPNIHIEHEQVGGYDDVRDQINNELTVGNQPNIAYCYPDHVAAYNLTKKVITLDDLIASTIEIERADGTVEVLGLTAEQQDDFIDGYYAEGREFGDGLMYTLPLSKSTEVLYYNVEFFTQHNLTVPTTWDEMEATLKAIKAIDPTSIPLGYDSESNWFITMCEQLGTDYTSATGDHYLFDCEENRNFVKRFSEWAALGYVTTQEIYGAYTSGLFVNTDATKTRSYMSIGSSAGATHQRPAKDDATGEYPFTVGIAPIPQLNKENPKAISQGPSLCIFNTGNDQEVVASWLFMKYLTTCVEFQAEFSMASGYVPVIESVKENEVYANFLEKADGKAQIAALSAKVCLENAEYYYTSPAFNGSSKARDMVGIIIQTCFTEIKTGTSDADKDRIIKEAFKYAVDECEYYAPSN